MLKEGLIQRNTVSTSEKAPARSRKNANDEGKKNKKHVGYEVSAVGNAGGPANKTMTEIMVSSITE